MPLPGGLAVTGATGTRFVLVLPAALPDALALAGGVSAVAVAAAVSAVAAVGALGGVGGVGAAEALGASVAVAGALAVGLLVDVVVAEVAGTEVSAGLAGVNARIASASDKPSRRIAPTYTAAVRCGEPNRRVSSLGGDSSVWSAPMAPTGTAA